MDKIEIKPGQHVAFLGMTGSGKTVLARKLLAGLRRVIVIDPKQEYKADGFRRHFSLPVLVREFRLIWRPKRGDDWKLADLIRKAWRRKNLTLYIDELQSLTDFFPRATEALTDVIRTGRSRNVAVWISTQRPAWVPRWFISESSHKFVFTMLDKADRQRASDVIGDLGKELVPLHHFFYHGVGMMRAEQLTLDLKRNKVVKALTRAIDKS